VNVAELERAGLVHLRPPPRSNLPDHWANTWNVKRRVVMEVPYVLARAALAVASPRPEHAKHDRELIEGANRLLIGFYPTPSSFERLALEHRVLRHNVASEWARRQGLAYVEARDLFCGTICHRSLTQLRFVPATDVRRVSGASASGVWWTMAKDGARALKVPPTSVSRRDDTTVELSSKSPYAVPLSGANAVDGVLNEQLYDPPRKVRQDTANLPLLPTVIVFHNGKLLIALQNVRVYVAAKHGETQDDTLSYGADIKGLITKRRHLADQFCDEEHIMVITSNKRVQRPGGEPHTSATLLCIPGGNKGGGGGGDGGGEVKEADPGTCLITSTDDSLAWAMGPTFARFLV